MSAAFLNSFLQMSLWTKEKLIEIMENLLSSDLQSCPDFVVATVVKVSHPLADDQIEYRVGVFFPHFGNHPSFAEELSIEKLIDAVLNFVHGQEVRNSCERVAVFHALVTEGHAAFLPDTVDGEKVSVWQSLRFVKELTQMKLMEPPQREPPSESYW
jgi:hypothetical protein